MQLPQILTEGAFWSVIRNLINANFAQSFPSQPTLLAASTGAIDPTTSATYVITYAGGAGAYTLAAPVVGTGDGVVITLITDVTQQPVLTATSLLKTGGTAVSVLTAAAHAGATVVLYARNGFWYVVSNNHWAESS